MQHIVHNVWRWFRNQRNDQFLQVIWKKSRSWEKVSTTPNSFIYRERWIKGRIASPIIEESRCFFCPYEYWTTGLIYKVFMSLFSLTIKKKADYFNWSHTYLIFGIWEWARNLHAYLNYLSWSHLHFNKISFGHFILYASLYKKDVLELFVTISQNKNNFCFESSQDLIATSIFKWLIII